jgi:hypothetical protein
MANADGKELLMLSSPVGFVLEEVDATQTPLAIKGFVSVESKDRSGDFVPADGFSIQQFMSAPTMLVNHAYWNDEFGNKVGVGRPLSLTVAKLASIAGDDANWAILDAVSGEQVNTFPKAKVPNLTAGDRGLFVTAEVTRWDVAQMVARGELGAFSWRGLAQVDYVVGKNSEIIRRLTGIDLWEVSLVNVPNNPNATFTVGKSVQGVRVAKSRFEGAGVASEYLKCHGVCPCDLREDSDFYYASLKPVSSFAAKSLVLTKMADGVEMIAGETAAPPMSTIAWDERALGAELVAKLALFEKEGTMTEAAKTAPAAEGTVVNPPAATDVANAAGKKKSQKDCGPSQTYDPDQDECVASKTAESAEAAMKNLGEMLATKTVEGLTAALTPVFAEMTKSMTTLSEGMQSIATKMAESPTAAPAAAPVTTPAVETAKNEVVSDPVTVSKSAEALQAILAPLVKVVADVQKAVDTVSKTTPAPIVRDERIDTSKTVAESPNSVFDNIFAFTKK